MSKKTSTKKSKYYEYTKNRGTENKPASFFKTFGQLLRQLKPLKGLMFAVCVSGIISTALSVSGPLLLGQIVDKIQIQVTNKLSGLPFDIKPVGNMLLIILGVYVLSSLMTYFQRYSMAGVAQKVTRSLREQINAKLSTLPLRFFDSNTKGDILSRIINDVDNIDLTLQNNLIQVITSLVTFFGVFAIMLKNSVMLSFTSLSPFPASLIFGINKNSLSILKKATRKGRA